MMAEGAGEVKREAVETGLEGLEGDQREPEAGRVPRGGPGRRRGGAAGPGGGGTAPLAVLCGM